MCRIWKLHWPLVICLRFCSLLPDFFRFFHLKTKAHEYSPPLRINMDIRRHYCRFLSQKDITQLMCQNMKMARKCPQPKTFHNFEAKMDRKQCQFCGSAFWRSNGSIIGSQCACIPSKLQKIFSRQKYLKLQEFSQFIYSFVNWKCSWK